MPDELPPVAPETSLRVIGRSIEDVTRPGWYTQAFDRQRLRVVVGEDGTVVSAVVG